MSHAEPCEPIHMLDPFAAHAARDPVVVGPPVLGPTDVGAFVHDSSVGPTVSHDDSRLRILSGKYVRDYRSVAMRGGRLVT